MQENINFKQFIPLILLALVLIGGIYYWQNQKSDNSSPIKSSGVVLGDAANQAAVSKITDSQTYSNKINELRSPINKNFEDLASKVKYPALFTADDIQKIINDARSKIEGAITTLQNLPIDAKFNATNQEELRSFNLLLEAINSFDQARKTSDKTESQRLTELYAYDIDQSNNILKNISISQ